MESWMINAAVFIGGLVAAGAVAKYVIRSNSDDIIKLKAAKEEFDSFVSANTPLLRHLSRTEDIMKAAADVQAKDLVELRAKVMEAPSMKDVRAEFVSKELYLQFEKHIDAKFSALEKGIDTIIAKLDKSDRDK